MDFMCAVVVEVSDYDCWPERGERRRQVLTVKLKNCPVAALTQATSTHSGGPDG